LVLVYFTLSANGLLPINIQDYKTWNHFRSGSSSAAASQVRQISWGSDSGISGDESSASRQNVSEVLQNSEAFQTVSELARKAGKLSTYLCL